MGWIARTPSQDRINLWRSTPQGGRKVSLWPHPNTIRIDPKYRLLYVSPEMTPLASRWGFYYRSFLVAWDPETPAVNAFGWFDFEVRGINHVGATIPVNEWGFGAEVDIQISDDLPPPIPEGIQVSIDLTRPSLPLLKQRGRYPTFNESTKFLYGNDTVNRHPTPAWFWTDVDPPTQEIHIVEIFGVSECYKFLEEDVGMASFNGTDAYIALDNLMSFSNNPFKLSCEVRLNQTFDKWPILGREGLGGFFGMEDDNVIFGNLDLDTSWTPVVDQWLTWVYEFEPVTQLQHKLTIAGTVVKDATHSRQFSSFDTIGVYKHGVSGTLWADMDVRDLKIETGTPGDYETLLDMPLRANALDIGPNLNHGTTFNMFLPSV